MKRLFILLEQNQDLLSRQATFIGQPQTAKYNWQQIC